MWRGRGGEFDEASSDEWNHNSSIYPHEAEGSSKWTKVPFIAKFGWDNPTNLLHNEFIKPENRFIAVFRSSGALPEGSVLDSGAGSVYARSFFSKCEDLDVTGYLQLTFDYPPEYTDPPPPTEIMKKDSIKDIYVFKQKVGANDD